MARTFDAIVIGAGHNGLVAAAELSRKGKRVCVIERSDRVGGMARTGELDGVPLPQIAHLLYNFDPAVAKDLGLSSQTAAIPTVALDPEGRHAVIEGDRLAYADGTDHPQAAVFATLLGRLKTFAAVLGQMADAPPPSLEEGLASLSSLTAAKGLAGLGLNLKRLGKDDMREFLRVLLSNAYDVILDELEEGPVAGLLAADAVRGAFNGPRAPGTVFTLLYRLGQGGEVTLPPEGMGAVMEALARTARREGAELRFGSGVARVELDGDRVTGVTLEDGSALKAPVVLSSLGAQRTMALAGPAQYDIEAVRRVRNLRSKGTTAKVNLVLSRAPEMPGLTEAQRAGRLVLAPTASYVERAFNPVKYGEMSRAPVIEAVMPTLEAGRVSAEDKQVLSLIVSYVPQDHADRDAIRDLAVDALAPFMPGLADLITATEVLTPADIEALTGAPGGHWHHAEMALDQVLTVRPVNGMARYAFGIEGYFLCGASAHPGGDVTGQPGRNAARRALASGAMT